MFNAMTTDFVREILGGDGTKLYFPNADWLFPNGLTIDRVMFTIPGLNIDVYWYGFLIALGMLLAMIYGFRRIKKWGLEPDRFTDTVLVGLLGGILGARVFYIIFSLEKYVTEDGTFDFIAALSVRDGGLAIYGGVIGALVFGCLMAKIRKVNIPALLDLVGLGFLIGQGLGRWGNFFNMEAYGAKTTLPWGMTSRSIINELHAFYYPDRVSVVTADATEMIAHPCFFYESLWCFLGLLILHICSKHRKFDGQIFLMYIGWYGLGRFWIEGLRTDSLYIPGTEFRVSQVIAGTCVLFAVVMLIMNFLSVKKNGVHLYVDSDESKELLALYEEKIKKSNSKGKNADDECETILDQSLIEEEPEETSEPSEEPTEEEAEEVIEEAIEETTEEPSVEPSESEEGDADNA